MKRDIEKDLIQWKNLKNRMPLLVRGARQVGKSYIIEKFGKEHFDTLVVINFEQNPKFSNSFQELDPKKIIASLEVLTRKKIIIGKTLLFLDEIQNCSQAILALRYFKEEMKDLHIIGAGSLLEFSINDKDFRMPVGRVQFMFLRPFSFVEFLEASNNQNLLDYLHSRDLQNPIEDVIHDKAILLVRQYLALGGMPAVLSEYFETQSILQCQDIQIALLTGFRNDFGKYAKYTQHKYLQLVFEGVPKLVAKWFKYSKIDSDYQSRDLKNALFKLKDAGIINFVMHTKANGMPLTSMINEKKFKVIFLDVGLMQRACNLNLDIIFNEDLLLINQGALMEQFVGQELLAYKNPREIANIFFWGKEQSKGSAEIDYVTNYNSVIIPIEVKAGKTGRLKSLRNFIQEKNCQIGIRISQNTLSFEKNILSIPFYMIHEMPRLLKNFLK